MYLCSEHFEGRRGPSTENPDPIPFVETPKPSRSTSPCILRQKKIPPKYEAAKALLLLSGQGYEATRLWTRTRSLDKCYRNILLASKAGVLHVHNQPDKTSLEKGRIISESDFKILSCYPFVNLKGKDKAERVSFYTPTKTTPTFISTQHNTVEIPCSTITAVLQGNQHSWDPQFISTSSLSRQTSQIVGKYRGSAPTTAKYLASSIHKLDTASKAYTSEGQLCSVGVQCDLGNAPLMEFQPNPEFHGSTEKYMY